MASRIKDLAEESRVAIRNVRRDANKSAENSEKDKSMSEDDCKHAKEHVQELTKKYENIVNDRAAGKEKEVMEN